MNTPNFVAIAKVNGVFLSQYITLVSPCTRTHIIPSYDTLWKHEIIHISILSPKCECRRHNPGGFPKMHVLPCTQSLTGELREKATQTDTTTQRERESRHSTKGDLRRNSPFVRLLPDEPDVRGNSV